MQATCELCGNEYAHCFEVSLNGQSHVFDSFECAIEALAPRCSHCHCRIIGHGVEREGSLYCCRHCMERSSAGARDPELMKSLGVGMDQASP